jgi:hypothetical protein
LSSQAIPLNSERLVCHAFPSEFSCSIGRRHQGQREGSSAKFNGEQACFPAVS